MSETELVGYELVEPCSCCDGTASGVVTEAIEGDLVVWTISLGRSGCGRTTETVEPGGMADTIVRQALVARVGLVQLQAEPDSSRVLRLRPHEVGDSQVAICRQLFEGRVHDAARLCQDPDVKNGRTIR